MFYRYRQVSVNGRYHPGITHTSPQAKFHYKIKRFFSGVHTCVNGADAITKWINVGRLCKVCECIVTVYTCMNSWKEPFNTYNSSTWIFSLFWLLNWFSGLLSIGHYRSFLSAAAILFIPVIQKSSSSYERIKNEKVHRVMNQSKTSTWQCSCPIKRHENDIYINSTRIILNWILYIKILYRW
jgi:hypothetical protein